MTSSNEQLVPVEQRPYPDLLSIEEQKQILGDAEHLWARLQENNIGGFSGINRPFHIVAEFKRIIERYGKRDVGLAWSKDDLDNYPIVLRTPPAIEPDEGLVERCVMVCPQCEGEGGYPDGMDEDACHTECTRCGSNGWIVDLATLTPSIRAQALEEAAQVADAHASNAWEIADRAGQNPIVGSGRNWAGREIASAIRAIIEQEALDMPS